MRKKTILTSIAVAALGLTSALASPAQDLFDQATFYLGFYYSGPGKIAPFRELRKQYQPELDKLCAGDAKCGYDKALTVINQIITSLNDPYVQVINDDFDRLAGGQGPARPRLGIVTRAHNGGLLVARTMEGEPAWEAGVERGDLIKTINGKPASLEALVTAELANQPITLAVERKGQAQNLNPIKPIIPEEGQKPAALRTTPKNVMVISVPDFYWDGEVAKRVHQLVRKANNDGTKNIVLDLRDSSSGFDSEAVWTARAFVEQISFKQQSRFQGSLRTFTVSGERITVNRDGVQGTGVVGQLERPQIFKGGIVVLVNRFTQHVGEMTAYLMQQGAKARVVGEPTSGQLGVSGGLPSLDISIGDTELINGLYINLSNDKILDASGKPWPMQVTPDVSVPEDLAAIAAGRDPALEKAYELLGVK